MLIPSPKRSISFYKADGSYFLNLFQESRVVSKTLPPGTVRKTLRPSFQEL
jgi:hypothetical protein